MSTSIRHICFLIRSLHSGGSERQLFELLKGLRDEGVEATVLTYYDGGEYWEKLASLPHVRVVSLRKKSRWDVLGFGYRLFFEVYRRRFDVLHTYLTSANILGAFLKLFRPKLRVVWGVRYSAYASESTSAFESALDKAEQLLCRFVDGIIVNSQRAQALWSQRTSKVQWVPNGIDTEKFRSDSIARTKIRQELQIPEDAKLIGLIGRYDRVKGHSEFLEACVFLQAQRSDLFFICVGGGSELYKKELTEKARVLGLRQIFFLPSSANVGEIYSALDILVSASLSEGFSNGIAEAMACGVPCVVTDVGDSALIANPFGEVVSARDPKGLAEGVLRLLEKTKGREKDFSFDCRRKIIKDYDNSLLPMRTLAALGRFKQKAV